MKKMIFSIAICFLMSEIALGQTPDLPALTLPQTSDDAPSMEEMRGNAEFMQIYKMRGGLIPAFEPALPPQNDNAPGIPPLVAPSHGPLDSSPSPTVSAVAVRQLAQLDRDKRLLLDDLQNAETCGYRAARFVSTADRDVQTAFQSGQYVPSSSWFHWAIHGDGFFVLRKRSTPADGDASPNPTDTEPLYYTRAGRFELTDDRKLALKHHGETYLLQPEIEIPPLVGDYDFRAGQLHITLPGGDQKDLGEWQLARFDHPGHLCRVDGVLFQAEPIGEKPTMFTPTETSGTTVRSREYEASNVDFKETLRDYRTLHQMQSAILEIMQNAECRMQN